LDGMEKCAKEMAADVKKQLYPGHGYVTGNLRNSIQVHRSDTLGTVTMGSNVGAGDPVIYTYWVETGKRRGAQTRFRGYHMFQNTSNKFSRNFKSCEKIISQEVIGRFD
jgi:hypothetical protein